MTHPPSVSLICAVLNEEDHLPDLLQQICDQDEADFEAIFADGGSDDRSVEILAAATKADHRIRFVHNPKTIQSAGLNHALALSEGEYVVRLDGHAQIPHDYVDRVVELLRTTGAGVAGGRMVPTPERGLVARAIGLANRSWWGAGPADFHRAGPPTETDTVYLGAFPREVLEAAGGWDERLVTNEDYELNHRIRVNGHAVWLDPSIEVGYTPRSTYRSLIRQYRRYGQGKASVVALHPSSVRVRQLLPAALVPGALVAVAIHPVLGLVGVFVHASLTGSLAFRADRRLGLAAGLAAFLMHWSWSLGFWSQAVRPATWLRRPIGASSAVQRSTPLTSKGTR